MREFAKFLSRKIHAGSNPVSSAHKPSLAYTCNKEYNTCMKSTYLHTIIDNFLIPVIVLSGLAVYLVLSFSNQLLLANGVVLVAIVLGSFDLVKETITSLLKKQFALDYIALLAVIVSIITGEYLVGGIIALMISSGSALEAYGAAQAKKSLTSLIDRIPQEVTLWIHNAPGEKKAIAAIKKDEEIYIRKGEVIPLDGILISNIAEIDEASLTGEAYFVDKYDGDLIRSGTVNMGNPIVIRITKEEADSTYRKIINLVHDAQEEKAPLIRLADKYSTVFTVITVLIAGFAYFYLGGLKGILAVLVVATPCPLIIATPIALLGGVSAAAKKRIIIKKLATLEVLQRVNTLVFDKTGTITLGQPQVTAIEILDKKMDTKDILGIASAIERSSLHPLAKAIVNYATDQKAVTKHAEQIHEEIGKGITGRVEEQYFSLRKLEDSTHEGMAIELRSEKTAVAIFHFTDVVKESSAKTIKDFITKGYNLHIFTGDKKRAADQVVTQLGVTVSVTAEMKPQDKQHGIADLKKQGNTVAMVGDGINDAPALALADVGIVFSNEEQTAASEAADIVLIGGDFSQVYETIRISKRAVQIALQSIIWGIGLSIFCMILAAFGLITPLLGAGIQEAIDVAVIINALRASR